MTISGLNFLWGDAGVVHAASRAARYLGFMPPQSSPDRLTEVLRHNLGKPDLRESSLPESSLA
jgi:hypothetical protein